MSNPSSDPLASVITQVQPGQGAPTTARGGPARPTKVAKPGTAKAAQQQTAAEQKKKKKKKKPVTSAATPEATAATSAAPTSSAAEAKSDSVAKEPSAADSASPQHSTEPSSTLAGTTISEATPTSAAGPGATASDAKAEPTTGEAAAPLGAAGKDSTEKVAHPSDLTTSTAKDSTLTPAPAPQTSATTPQPSSTAAPPAATAPGESSSATTPARSTAATKQRSKKSSRSPFKKLIAILTCTTASSAIVEEGASSQGRKGAGEDIEMQSTAVAAGPSQGRKTSSKEAATAAAASPTNGTARTDNGKLAPPTKPRSGRSGSRSSGSARNSLDRRSETGVVAPAPGTPTAGGGTQLPKEETGDVMSGAVVPPGSSFVVPGGSKRGGSSASATPTPSKKGGSGGDSDVESESDASSEASDDDQDDDVVDEYADDEISEEQRLIAQGGMGIPTDEFGNPRPLLAPLAPQDAGRKCLVLDLDETLVHSSFKMISNADFIVPVEIEGTLHNVYVIKRPGVDEFMRQMGEIYEVVVFTASLSKYADPVLDILDVHRVVRHRLFRESCYNHRGNYVKDLSQLGRPIEDSIIIDNSPASYVFHNGNAVPISSWFNDPHDTELVDLCPFLEDLSEVHDVRAVLDGGL